MIHGVTRNCAVDDAYRLAVIAEDPTAKATAIAEDGASGDVQSSSGVDATPGPLRGVARDSALDDIDGVATAVNASAARELRPAAIIGRDRAVENTDHTTLTVDAATVDIRSVGGNHAVCERQCAVVVVDASAAERARVAPLDGDIGHVHGVRAVDVKDSICLIRVDDRGGRVCATERQAGADIQVARHGLTLGGPRYRQSIRSGGQDHSVGAAPGRAGVDC